MAEAENKRPRRYSARESKMNWMKKITKINQSINELEEKKESCHGRVRCEDHRSEGAHQISGGKEAGDPCPKPPVKRKKQKIQEIVKLAMKNGMSVEEIAGQLHVEVEN